MLPARAAGQRLVDDQSPHAPHRSPGVPRLELAGSVPVRVNWSRRDLALAGGFAAALLLDAAQTRRLARTGWRDYEESNVILGPSPSVGQVNTYTALSALTVFGIAALAPKRVRPWVLGTALAVEVVALAMMSREGVAIRIL
jgi:hypothetical protein